MVAQVEIRVPHRAKGTEPRAATNDLDAAPEDITSTAPPETDTTHRKAAQRDPGGQQTETTWAAFR